MGADKFNEAGIVVLTQFAIALAAFTSGAYTDRNDRVTAFSPRISI